MKHTIDRIKTPVDAAITRCYNFANLCVKYPACRKALKKNKAYKNKHSGARCFILGNGPSLNRIDFSKLSVEYVFTVNQLFKHPLFGDLHSDYHIWTDPVFFDMSEEERLSPDYVDGFFKINTAGNKPVCFLPLQAKGYIERFGIDRELDIHYIHTCLTFFDGISPFGDFTKPAASFATVVINAIQLAIYMGFDEIFLLGCDCTGIMAMIEKELGKNVSSYAYKMSDRDVRLVNTDFEGEFERWTKTFHQYKWIGRACAENKIRLVNCTENSILNVLPFVPLERVLEEKIL